MAVRSRILNSTMAFCGHEKSQCYTVSGEGIGSKMEKESKEDLRTLFTKAILQGTANQLGSGPLVSEKYSSFIAQEMCESKESQEFSPSCSDRSNCLKWASPEPNNVAQAPCVLKKTPEELSPHYILRRKIQKRQRQKEKKRAKPRKEKKRKQRQRRPSGVPEQESGEYPQTVQAQEEGPEYQSSGIQHFGVQDTECTPYTALDYIQGSSHSPRGWNSHSLHSNLLTYGQESHSDSPLSSIGDCTLALKGLRGSVSQEDSCYAAPFVKDVEKEIRQRLDEEKDSNINEGIVFHEELLPQDYEYREGREYSLCHLIKSGSFGDVYCVQDTNTGFKCAGKKVPLNRFTSEEVGTWSALESPRVVELFGVVREGAFLILLMDLKSSSLGQLLKERGRLPEDLALHYLGQVLEALEYLRKRRVLHLDIKADNVLLSEDGKDTFLCDFGYAERLDKNGQSLSASRDLKGTETHMAPEVAKGEPRGAKADVWSSSSMLLHMLNGCHPWTRYYSRPLLLKIAHGPPPLREIPHNCSPHTANVLKAGLQKDPSKRASATELKQMTDKALQQVGGLKSSVRGTYQEPLQSPDESFDVLSKPPLLTFPAPSPRSMPRDVLSVGPSSEPGLQSMSAGVKEGGHKDYSNGEEGKEADTEKKVSPDEVSGKWEKNKTPDIASTVFEEELRKLEIDFYLSSLSQPHSAEIQEQLLSCLSSDSHTQSGVWDKKDSGRWSVTADDLSSGVFSYNSQPDRQSFSMDWLGPNQPITFRYFGGVDVCIRDLNGKSLWIRESPKVKVGRIATGISNQISERVFSIESQDGSPVSHDEEVQDSGLLLHCVSAPDDSPVWRWRISEGVLQTRD